MIVLKTNEVVGSYAVLNEDHATGGRTLGLQVGRHRDNCATVGIHPQSVSRCLTVRCNGAGEGGDVVWTLPADWPS